MKIKFFLILILLGLYSHGQSHWQAVGDGILNPNGAASLNPNFRGFYSDSINQRLYVCLGLDTYLDNQHTGGIAYLENGKWHPLGQGIQSPNTSFVKQAILFNDTLFVIGTFEQMDSLAETKGIAAWVDDHWVSTGLNFPGNLLNLKIFEDKLIITGAFDSIQGEKFNGMAAYQNGKIQPFIPNIDLQVAYVSDLEWFDGKLYIGGNFFQFNDLVAVDSAGLSVPGMGLSGSNSDLWDLQKYKGKLYVAGNMSMQLGDPGNGIASWDGQTWSNLQGGIPYGTVKKMTVYKDLLFVAGNTLSPQALGEGSSDFLAVWDGNEWRAIHWNFSGSGLNDLVVHQDTLYIGGNFLSIDGKPMNHMAFTTHNFPLSLHETSTNEDFFLYPNPAANHVSLSINKDLLGGDLMVFNAQGKMVKSIPNLQFQTISLHNLPSGTYFFRYKKGQISFKKSLLIHE